MVVEHSSSRHVLRQETRRDQENRERHEREVIFQREHQAKAAILDANMWGPTGKPGPAGKGPQYEPHLHRG